MHLRKLQKNSAAVNQLLVTIVQNMEAAVVSGSQFIESESEIHAFRLGSLDNPGGLAISGILRSQLLIGK